MSGLNDDVNAEFPEPAKEDGITQPGTVDIPNDQTAILDTTTTIPEDYSAGTSNQVDASGNGVVAADADETEGTKEIMPTIANYDTWIKTEEDRIPQLHRLRDITETILAVESIGLETLHSIEHKAGPEVLERIEQDVGAINTFTALPTSTNLRETKNCLRRLLQEKEAEVSAYYAAIRANQFAAIKDQLAKRKAAAGEAIAVITEAVAEAKAALVVLTNSKNTYFSIQETEGQTTTTLCVRLTDVPMNQLVNYQSVIPGFSPAILTAGLDSINALKAINDVLERVHTTPLNLTPSRATTDFMTYRELLQMFSAFTAQDNVVKVMAILEEQVENLNESVSDRDLQAIRANLFVLGGFFNAIKFSPELEIKAIINMFTKVL